MHTIGMLGRGFWTTVVAISAGSLIAQQPTASPTGTLTPVHFVGCQFDGQTGALKAPSGKDPLLPIGAALAKRLAYYSYRPLPKSARGIGGI